MLLRGWILPKRSIHRGIGALYSDPSLSFLSQFIDFNPDEPKSLPYPAGYSDFHGLR
jgi:hypothetical protein